MALPILTVVGATGIQGASVIAALHSATQPQYQIRAMTSSPSSPAATRLANQPNISVVAVDLNSYDSVLSAFEDSTLIYANTIFDPKAFASGGAAGAQRQEEQQGLNIVRAAAKIASLKHLIWSTLPDTVTISDGKYDVPHFHGKIPAEKFVKSAESGLADRTTLFRIGMYGSNLGNTLYRPIYVEAAKKHLVILPCSPDGPVPFIGDETVNIGVIVKAIFAQPGKSLGRYVLGGPEIISCQEWTDSLTRALKRQGKDADVAFVECSMSAFERIWGPFGTEIGLMMTYFRDFGRQSFEADTGTQPALTAKDLGVEAEMRTSEDRLSAMDWSSIVVSQ